MHRFGGSIPCLGSSAFLNSLNHSTQTVKGNQRNFQNNIWLVSNKGSMGCT
jgi:hypothetical protein